MWKLPMFGCTDPSQVLKEIRACEDAFPNSYVRIVAFDNVRQVRSYYMSCSCLGLSWCRICTITALVGCAADPGQLSMCVVLQPQVLQFAVSTN